MLRTKAAVTHGKGESFKIEDITIDDPKVGEVLVRIQATGICHTDLIVRDQYYPVPLPAVLGHEGSGIVEKVGEGVSSVKPGDHVVMSYSSCGDCSNCRSGDPYACNQFFELNFTGTMKDGSCRLHQDGRDVHNFFGQSSFANFSIVSERNVVKVPKDVPLDLLGPLGCGIQTGSGAVLNKLKPKVGSSIVIFGCGAVGLSAVMGAKVASCTTIIAIDFNESRLELAKELGATHTINPKDTNSVEEIQKITGGGVNYSIETTSRPEVLRQAVDCLATLGQAVVIGAPPVGTEVHLDVNTILFERSVIGVLLGSAVPQMFIPKLIELYKQGKFPFDKLIKFYSLEEINQASADSESGVTIKPVLKIG
ncbi:NAD(P)-dependent alcohol dehydrogenase [Fictibacillus terranigra]|uniref:NAD(P)-dependent alcohol dehydrogenase n=1 Tax=Fictibacillus terranigra TaxID=3058424 RepID=A0ABT8E2T6_9BACL|nr:NAD(P)-dependent alcohol dehydrogenase [Fictibacillus sp. CENA-BCM004]MDN4072208.1 NAD(P)-dependent alcohol dehydrogenase [Fictibacillus sp. CENA-BCM004]